MLDQNVIEKKDEKDVESREPIISMTEKSFETMFPTLVYHRDPSFEICLIFSAGNDSSCLLFFLYIFGMVNYDDVYTAVFSNVPSFFRQLRMSMLSFVANWTDLIDVRKMKCQDKHKCLIFVTYEERIDPQLLFWTVHFSSKYVVKELSLASLLRCSHSIEHKILWEYIPYFHVGISLHLRYTQFSSQIVSDRSLFKNESASIEYVFFDF